MAEDQEKKIITDDDWKAQAQKEKEKLTEKEKNTSAGAGASRGPLPEAGFPLLVQSLATQAMLSMGLFAIDPNEPPKVDLDMARHTIDMLAMLEEKTKGNLDEKEESLLAVTLHELRMQYVQVAGGGKGN